MSGKKRPALLRAIIDEMNVMDRMIRPPFGKAKRSAPTAGLRWTEGITMKVIESDKILPLFRLLLMNNKYADPIINEVQEIVDMQSIDPVHTAGGCYCKECIYQTYDEEFDRRWCNRDLGCRAVRADGLGFCDQGMEAQE